MFFIYNTILVLVSIFLLPYLILRIVINPLWRDSLHLRIPILSRRAKDRLSRDEWIWLHAASIGEVRCISQIARRIISRYPSYKILITTMTTSGMRQAEESGIGDIVTLIPLDIPFFIGRIVKAANFKLLIILESEFWPNLLRKASKKARVMLLNGRISDRHYKRYLLLRPFMKRVLSSIDLLSMRTKTDLERIVRMGAERERCVLGGDIKFDMLANLKYEESRNGLRGLLGIREDEPVVVAGSTHEDEEEILVNVYRSLSERFPNMYLIIAPRHVQRIPKLDALLKEMGLEYAYWSSLIKGGSGSVIPHIILIDVMGELMKAYGISDIAFVGGSLVNIGGHNILEPAFLKKPVLFGQHIQNFRDSADMLIEQNGGLMVKDAADFRSQLKYLLENPEERESIGKNGFRIIEENQGAIENNLKFIHQLLHRFEWERIKV